MRFNWQSLTIHITVYHLVVVIGFIISVALAIAIPAKMSDPDDWAYYYTTQNFAGGHLTVDTQTHQQPGSVVLPLNGFLIDSILREKESRKS